MYLTGFGCVSLLFIPLIWYVDSWFGERGL